ncbi:RHS repeat-associated core domain-containing protein [Colwelliaceae bacterium 6441]
MQARYYEPVIGRFYSNDPVGFRDVHSFNRYAYANNNPYKYIDPDGRESLGVLIGNWLSGKDLKESVVVQ